MNRREFLASLGAALDFLALAPIAARSAGCESSAVTHSGAAPPTADGAPPVAVPRDPYGWWDSTALDRAAARNASTN